MMLFIQAQVFIQLYLAWLHLATIFPSASGTSTWMSSSDKVPPNPSTTPPPNSSSSAIRAWAKPGWAGGWRTASSRNTPPRTASSSGPSTQLGLKRKDGTECEAVLWDLAGQHVYRQIHSIFLENVAAALVLFDPSNRQEPLKGVQFWLEQLKGKGQLPPAVLVGARVDRGAPALSQQELDQFCQRYGIAAATSAPAPRAAKGWRRCWKRSRRRSRGTR